MKFIRLILLPSILLCVVTALLMQPHQTAAAAGESEEFRKGEVIVEIAPGASIEAINERNRTTTIERIYGTNFYRLNVPQDKSENKWIKRLQRDAEVLSASLNPVVMSPTAVFARATVGFPNGHPTTGCNRTAYTSQPDLFNLLSLSDSQLRSRGKGVVVAIIDTGVDRTHPDIASHLWRDNRSRGETGVGGADDDHDGLIGDAWGWDFVDNDNDPTEEADDSPMSVAGHGTFIAGLIALIAPECRIMPIRAFARDGMSNAFTVAAAIKYATDHGANVINLSFGSPRKSSLVRQAIKYARQKAVILIAAMGNENEDTDSSPQYPAILNDVIGVAAIDADSRKAAFSNFGSNVRVDALGVKLTSTFPGAHRRSGDYATWSGTSFAAPLTAAEAALILSEERRQDARSTIEDTAVAIDDLNPDFSGKLGRGRINPLAALDSLFTDKTPAGNYVSIAFTPGPDEIRARGGAGISITGSRQEFEIAAQSLGVRATYSLVVDGKDFTPDGFAADSFGGLEVAFSTNPNASDETSGLHLPLPAGLDSVMDIKHIELRNGDRVVLEGTIVPVNGGTRPSGQWVEKRAPLLTTGLLPKAGGKADVEIGPEREELSIEAARLTPGFSFRILVDGTDLGWAAAQSGDTGSGFFRVRLTGDGTNGPTLPPSLRSVMNINHVELRDSADQIILQGDFLSGGGDISGNRLSKVSSAR